MAAYRSIGGTWRQGSWWRNIGGVWKRGTMWRNIGGVWKPVSGNILTTGTFFSGGTYTGYSLTPFGTLAPNTFPQWPGQVCVEMFHFTGTGQVHFTIAGVQPNSGWTNLYVDGTTYSRASAAYVAGSNTTWSWVSGNPFGLAGSVHNVTVA